MLAYIYTSFDFFAFIGNANRKEFVVDRRISGTTVPSFEQEILFKYATVG